MEPNRPSESMIAAITAYITPCISYKPNGQFFPLSQTLTLTFTTTVIKSNFFQSVRLLQTPDFVFEMAEAIVWLDGNANFGIEKICPKRHVTQNEWQSAWNEEYLNPPFNTCTYDYISDYECIFNCPIDHWNNNNLQDDQERWQNLQAAKEQGTNVPITNLAHFTKQNAAEQICDTNGFIGGQKKINEEEFARLSWWSPIFTPQDINQVRVHLGNAIQPFLGEGDNQLQLRNQFATSDAFQPNPNLYGNHFFQYGIEDLCQYYGGQFVGEVQYKILGTFGYKQEVMHAVLVCSQVDGAPGGKFAAYPNVLAPAEDVNNEAVITRDGEGNWVWKPQATATEIIRLQAHLQDYPIYRRWEHVAFAFHIPEDLENGMMMAGNPADHHKSIDSHGNIKDVPKLQDKGKKMKKKAKKNDEDEEDESVEVHADLM